MMIIPKTLKVKEVVKNHITVMVGGVFICALLLTLFLTFFIVHAYFKLVFFIVCVVTLWLVLYPSEWNRDITRAEMFLKFLLMNRSNQYALTRKDVKFGVQYYEREKYRDKAAEKRKKAARKRTY